MKRFIPMLSLVAATGPHRLRPHEHVILELETRLDRSTADVFNDRDGHDNRQFLAPAGAVVTF